VIKDARRKRLVKGIKNYNSLVISHLLFVYDIMTFGHGYLREIISIKEILGIYCKVTSMEINLRKSSMVFNELAKEERFQIANILPMN
jgi:hypothetical protein